MSAQRLRDAATMLRHHAHAATPGPWEARIGQHAEPYVGERGRGLFGLTAIPNHGNEDYGKADAEYIATMHPGVALALADWLMEAAEAFDDWAASSNPTVAHWNVERGIKVADLILGAE